MRTIAWLAGVLLLLTGCYKPTPVSVPFPDDPRVLHGDWSLEVISRQTMPHFRFDGSAANLLIGLREARNYHFIRSTDGWTELFREVPEGNYDSVLGAFVSLQRQGSAVRIRIQDLEGERSERQVPLTEGYSHQRLLVASGRLFSISGGEANTAVVHWWNLQDPTDHGKRTLHSQRDGILVSSNGRIVSFWDLSLSRTHLLDTARPEISLSVPLAVFCRATGLGEASADGRWFVVRSCGSSLILHDLQKPESGGRRLAVTASDRVTFAADTSELLWSDSSGVISSLNVLGGSPQTLHGSSAQEREHRIQQWSAPYLHRSTGTLAFTTQNGYVLVSDLESGEHHRLPAYEITEASLLLRAEPPEAAAPWTWYSVTGVWQHGGNEYLVEGEVHSGHLHIYRPDSLSPARAPPPEVNVYLNVHEAAGDPESEELKLTLLNRDPLSSEFYGQLELLQGGEIYNVRLFRE